MDKQKEELFLLNDVLKENLFTITEKKNIQNNISNYGVNILNNWAQSPLNILITFTN